MVCDRFDHLFIAPSDFDASLKFYCYVMKWEIIREWKSSEGARGVVLSGGGIELILAERHHNGESSHDDGIVGNEPTLHLDIHDIEARFREVPSGDHVVIGPQDTHWGIRRFVLKDPDGNLIAFDEKRQKR